VAGPLVEQSPTSLPPLSAGRDGVAPGKRRYGVTVTVPPSTRYIASLAASVTIAAIV
jgi:hypothetical protein